jgi:hypothetical protein
MVIFFKVDPNFIYKIIEVTEEVSRSRTFFLSQVAKSNKKDSCKK